MNNELNELKEKYLTSYMRFKLQAEYIYPKSYNITSSEFREFYNLNIEHEKDYIYFINKIFNEDNLHNELINRLEQQEDLDIKEVLHQNPKNAEIILDEMIMESWLFLDIYNSDKPKWFLNNKSYNSGTKANDKIRDISNLFMDQYEALNQKTPLVMKVAKQKGVKIFFTKLKNELYKRKKKEVGGLKSIDRLKYEEDFIEKILTLPCFDPNRPLKKRTFFKEDEEILLLNEVKNDLEKIFFWNVSTYLELLDEIKDDEVFNNGFDYISETISNIPYERREVIFVDKIETLSIRRIYSKVIKNEIKYQDIQKELKLYADLASTRFNSEEYIERNIHNICSKITKKLINDNIINLDELYQAKTKILYQQVIEIPNSYLGVISQSLIDLRQEDLISLNGISIIKVKDKTIIIVETEDKLKLSNNEILECFKNLGDDIQELKRDKIEIINKIYRNIMLKDELKTIDENGNVQILKRIKPKV